MTAGPERSIWRCEKCNAYHIGGLDLTSSEGEGDVVWTAVCGATYKLNGPDAGEMWETPLVATDPYNAHPEPAFEVPARVDH